MPLRLSGTAPNTGLRPRQSQKRRKDPHYHERELQIWLVQWFRRHVMEWDALLGMLANGEYRTPETVDLLERMGMINGMTDLALILRGGRIRWIEIKLANTFRHAATQPTQAQREHHSLLRELDHKVDIVRGVTDLMAIVEEEGVPHRPWAAPAVQEHFTLSRRRGAHLTGS